MSEKAEAAHQAGEAAPTLRLQRPVQGGSAKRQHGGWRCMEPFSSSMPLSLRVGTFCVFRPHPFPLAVTPA